MNRFVLGFILACCLWNLQNQWKAEPFIVGMDFKIYYHATAGDTHWIESTKHWRGLTEGEKLSTGWLYDARLASLWLPWTFFCEKTALILWMLLCHLLYFALCLKVMEHPYGWLIVLGTWKPLATTLVSGNVSPVLAYLLTTALGRLAAPAVKCHLVPLALILSAGGGIARRRRARTGARQRDLSAPALAHDSETEEMVDAPPGPGGALHGTLSHGA
jgi:hypothetical protein